MRTKLLSLFTLLLLVSTFADAQRTGVNWPGGYYFTGSFSVGVNQQGTGNNAAYPATSAYLRIGPDTGNKGMQPARGLDTANVLYPRPLGLQFFQYKDSSYYEWLGNTWRALSNRATDSTVFITGYQLDTAKANLRTEIAAGSGGGIAGNLVLNKTGGGQVGYDVPNGYTFNPTTLYDDELAGTITKVAETYPPAPIPYPLGWTWQPVIPLRYNDGSVKGNITPDDFRARYMPRGKKYYAAPAIQGGSALNNGLTPASPLTLDAAYAKTDVVEISLIPGYYTGVADFSTPIRKTISIYCLTGKAYVGRISQTDEYRHLDATGTPGIWYSEYSGSNGLVYLNQTDTFGNKVPLKKVFTEAEMLATENTYYIYGYPDHGMKCHLPAGFTPVNVTYDTPPYDTANIMLIETNANGLFDVIDDPTIVNQTLYIENVVCVGQGLARMNAGCSIYAQGCSFLYAQNDGDELTVQGGDKVILYRCNTGYAGLDAFSYTGTKYVAEIECTGNYANLYFGNASNQISTAHAGTIVVRIGCIYINSQFATTDVTGSQSFNVGLYSRNTVATPFAVWDGSAHGYYIDCSGVHSGAKYEARNTAVSEVQGARQPVVVNPQAGGTLKYYGFSLN